jgi:hypothetical protein
MPLGRFVAHRVSISVAIDLGDERLERSHCATRSAQSCAALREITRDISRGSLERVGIETRVHLESTCKSALRLRKVH